MATKNFLKKCLFSAAVALGSMASATAQFIVPSNINGWMPNGTINAMAEDANYYYLGGDFSAFIKEGTTTHTRSLGMAFSLTGDGTPVSGYPVVAPYTPSVNYKSLAGDIRACAPDGTGGWFIAGEFNHVGGIARKNIAHIKADKTVDLAWEASTDGLITALAVSGSDIFISGNFTEANGQARKSLAKLNATTGALDVSWNPSCDRGAKRLLAAGNYLYVVGWLNAMAVNNTNLKGVARINTTGAGNIDASWNLNTDNEVKSIALSGDGNHVFLGGKFTTIGGVARPYVAKISVATATVDATWNPTAVGNSDNMVSTIAVSGNDLYIGGKLNGRTLAKINTTGAGATDAGWNHTANYAPEHMELSGADLYVLGQPSNATLTQSVAKINNVGSLDPAWSIKPHGLVHTMVVANGHLYLGGSAAGFNTIGGKLCKNLARLHKATMELDETWTPNPDNFVTNLAIHSSGLFVGGIFNNIGGLTRKNFAKVKTTGTGEAEASCNVSGVINLACLLVNGSDLYMGGHFTAINPLGSYLLKLDINTNALDTNFAPDFDYYVHSLVMLGSELLVGGRFTSVNGQTQKGLAKINATTGALNTTWNPSANIEYMSANNVEVTDIALSGTDLFVMGNMRAPRQGILKISTTGAGAIDGTWSGSLSLFPMGHSLVVKDGWVYASGSFTPTYPEEVDVVRFNLTTGMRDIFWKPQAISTYILGVTSTHILISSPGSLFGTDGVFKYGLGFNMIPITAGTIIAPPVALQPAAATPAVASTSQNFALSGNSLTANTTLSVSTTDWELSKDNVNFYNTVSYAANNGALADVPVYIRLKKGLVVGNKSATLTMMSAGAVYATMSLSGTVTKANQTISFPTITDKPANTQPLTLNATSDSGLPIAYELTTVPATGVATLSGNVLTIVGLGKVSLKATQAGDESYNAASEVIRTFDVVEATSTEPLVVVGEVVAYPSPNKTGVYRVSGVQKVDAQKVQYTVFDETGKAIQTGIWAGKDIETLNLSQTKGGVYYLRLNGTKKMAIQKIVKE